MTQLTFRKHFGSLVPDEASDPAAVEWLRTIKHGSFVTIERPKKPRNVAHHRKFFAMLKLVYDNQEYYRSMDDLLNVCKLAIGHCDQIATKKFGVVSLPKSLSFANVDQHEFEALYDAAVHWVLSEVIPGMKRADLDAEVEAELTRFAA